MRRAFIALSALALTTACQTAEKVEYVVTCDDTIDPDCAPDRDVKVIAD